MRVACVVVPHFLVEVERQHEPGLRERAVVVGGAPEERKDVLDCSVEAMERGVRPGMSLREALSRCPEAIFVEAHPERYEATMLAMVHALLEISSLVEPAHPEVIYLGIDGQMVGPFPGTERAALVRPAPKVDPLEGELAETIVAAAEEASGLQVRVGIADGKFAAYVAAVLGTER
jgi:DNA polymerase IV